MVRVLFALCFLLFSGCAVGGASLNDRHSGLNATDFYSIEYPEDTDDIVDIVKSAKRKGKAISISGARHAMGGQQFGADTIHISMSEMNDVLNFDKDNGVVRVVAGIIWPDLMSHLYYAHQYDTHPWGIIQKQTGADRLSIGGALSANVHGRGLHFKPIIQDVEAFTLVNAEGEVLTVNRDENRELFKLVIGGYGLFGVIATVDLKLQRRRKVKRVVDVVDLNDLERRTRRLIKKGYLYGDYQYFIDEKSPNFMEKGVLAAYVPVPDKTALPDKPKKFSKSRWHYFLYLAHTDKTRAFNMYSSYYLSTDGEIYWSDLHQLSYYNPEYEDYLRKELPNYTPGSLMISEVYVPLKKIKPFVRKVQKIAREREPNVIYGTMRMIRKDNESYLAWAKQDYACVIFNLRVDHTENGMEKAKGDFRALIDAALSLGGSYYLTYHRWARKDQVVKAHPKFVKFLKKKKKYDPEERFQSDWYRHYREMFAEELKE